MFKRSNSNEIQRGYFLMLTLFNRMFTDIKPTNTVIDIEEAMSICCNSHQPVRDSLSLLETWGFVSRHRDGRRHKFALTNKACEFIDTHFDYVQMQARGHEATIIINDGGF